MPARWTGASATKHEDARCHSSSKARRCKPLRLATGECYRSCGLMVGLAKPTVVKSCHKFVQEICRHQDEFIKFPSTAAEIAKKIKGFDNKSNLPNVVGAIDGSHVPIKAPKINHEDYFNRKHFYRFLVQGIVDASDLYLSVATGFPGSLHDARMVRLTDVYWAAADENILMEPTFDLGGTIVRPLIVEDTAYPNKTWLIRPFKDDGGLTRAQRNFNREISKARIVSEHAFGMTKGRWRVLLKRLDEDSDRIPDTIIACCVLHNICVLRGNELDIDDSDDDDAAMMMMMTTAVPPPRLQLRFYKPLFNTLQINRQYPLDFVLFGS